MSTESLSFVAACIIDGLDMNWFINLKQPGRCLHLSKQCLFAFPKLA